MKMKRWHKVSAVIIGVALVLVISGLVGVSGCGEDEQADKAGAYSTTVTNVWSDVDEAFDAEEAGIAMDEMAATAPEAEYRDVGAGNSGSSLEQLEQDAGQKIMKDAILDLEVEKGSFQKQFDKAQQLAGLYGGYVLSSNSTATGDEDVIKSGSVTIRVPADSFDKMMAEAKKLGVVKYENTSTTDVTEEYTDLASQITIAEANVNAILTLYSKAKTIEEILQVQQQLMYAQQQLEQLKGRMQYLESHTTYSTLTMNIYEPGTEVTPPEEEWGFVQALKDAAHNVVDAFSAVAKGLGWIIPVLVIVGILIGIIYVTVKVAGRKKSRKAGDEEGKSS